MAGKFISKLDCKEMDGCNNQTFFRCSISLAKFHSQL